MSYIIDDDASQFREVKDKLDKLQSDFLSSQFSVQQENVESGQSIFPGANPSARGGGTGGSSGGLTEPLRHTVKDHGDVSLTTESITADTHNVFRLRLTGNIGISISETLPILKFQMLHLVLIQDGIGGHEVTSWDSAINGTPTIDTTADSVTTVSLYSIDQGVTWFFVSNRGGVVGGGTTVLSGLTIDVDKDWATRSITNLGHVAAGGTVADSGFTRLINDAIGVSWRNVANDGNLELKVDSGDFFDFTESNNGPVTLQVRAQHATNPDNTLTLTQFSGTTGVGQFFAPNQMQFLGSGSSAVFNYDQNRIETNVNILPDADGTISIGAVASRYLDMYAAGFKFDINRRLDFNTGGGGIAVNGVSDTFTITVDSVLKQTMSATLTTLAGNVGVGGNLDLGGYIDIPEISTPANPAADNARIYSKDDGGTTKLYFRDSAGTETELGAAGGLDNEIIQGDTSIVITDTGVGGAVVTKVDNVQKMNISTTQINLDDDVVLGLLSTDSITFNGAVVSDVIPEGKRR